MEETFLCYFIIFTFVGDKLSFSKLALVLEGRIKKTLRIHTFYDGFVSTCILSKNKEIHTYIKVMEGTISCFFDPFRIKLFHFYVSSQKQIGIHPLHLFHIKMLISQRTTVDNQGDTYFLKICLVFNWQTK